MKAMTFAELAAMPDGTIFEYEHGPAHHTPGIHRKVKTWAADEDDPDDEGPGISTVNLSYLVEHGDTMSGATWECLTEDEGVDYEFRVYEPANVARLVALLNGSD